MENRFNFRAYIVKENYMVDVEILHPEYISSYDGKTYSLNNTNNSKKYILMQSTGLTDKNGKKIFEGDVVRFLNKKGVIKEVCGTLVCYWTKDYISNDTGFYNYMPYFPHNDLKLEVIGNIYENDYLLNNKEKSFINVKKLLKK